MTATVRGNVLPLSRAKEKRGTLSAQMKFAAWNDRKGEPLIAKDMAPHVLLATSRQRQRAINKYSAWCSWMDICKCAMLMHNWIWTYL